MKKLIPLLMAFVVVVGCGPEKPNTQGTDANPVVDGTKQAVDFTKGIGQVKNVTLHTPLEQDRVGRGQAIYEMKCSACHKLDATRVVGPGWKDVTKRRKPEWIMNMITNVDMMLDQDPEAQKLLELCLMRMPNQNVAIGDARDILEFMRQNDGEK
jgi:cytochrome c